MASGVAYNSTRFFTCLTDLAALSTLHRLLVDKALRIQGAWPHAIEGPGNQFAILGVQARS
jgi:hypothetical protein